MFIEMRIVPMSVQIVYRGNDFYAQDFLLAGVKATSSFYVLLRDVIMTNSDNATNLIVYSGGNRKRGCQYELVMSHDRPIRPSAR
jgi:hypothetical protein